MTKKDIVEVILKLPALFYGFKTTAVLIVIPIDMIMGKGCPSPYPIIGVLLPFLLGVVMIWKTEMIIGWLFKNEK
jgi:hypothetical protein